MIRWSLQEQSHGKFALLFLISYIFLLRLPSEALPIVLGSKDKQSDSQAVLYKDDGKLFLKLRCRKNRPEGSLLVRECWCKFCRFTCPVHVVGRLVDKLPVGRALFSSISRANALETLRFMLEQVGTPNATKYRTQDLRRGHALDLQMSGASTIFVMHTPLEITCLVCWPGAPLAKILLAGEWKPPAFLTYLDCDFLEREAVLQVQIPMPHTGNLQLYEPGPLR